MVDRLDVAVSAKGHNAASCKLAVLSCRLPVMHHNPRDLVATEHNRRVELCLQRLCDSRNRCEGVDDDYCDGCGRVKVEYQPA